MKHVVDKKKGDYHDFVVYCKDLKLLFMSTDEKSYNTLFNARRKVWDNEFTEYYINNIHSNISNIGQCGLENISAIHWNQRLGELEASVTALFYEYTSSNQVHYIHEIRSMAGKHLKHTS